MRFNLSNITAIVTGGGRVSEQPLPPHWPRLGRPFDDLDTMMARREEIERDKLYSMCVKSFESSATASLVAIRERGANS